MIRKTRLLLVLIGLHLSGFSQDSVSYSYKSLRRFAILFKAPLALEKHSVIQHSKGMNDFILF